MYFHLAFWNRAVHCIIDGTSGNTIKYKRLFKYQKKENVYDDDDDDDGRTMTKTVKSCHIILIYCLYI